MRGCSGHLGPLGGAGAEQRQPSIGSQASAAILRGTGQLRLRWSLDWGLNMRIGCVAMVHPGALRQSDWKEVATEAPSPLRFRAVPVSCPFNPSRIALDGGSVPFISEVVTDAH